jgi:hypothetical protein
MGLHRHTQCFGDIWLLFGILFSVCVFVGTPKMKTNIWPSICATNKKNEYTNKKVVILYAYPCIDPDKSLFWQNKYKKDGCKGKNLRTEEKPSFVYLCIGV